MSEATEPYAEPYESTQHPAGLPRHLERIASRDYCGVNEGFWILRDAASYITDLQAAKVMEMSDAQVVALLGGQDAAEEAASHAGYVMRVALREDAMKRAFRKIQLIAAAGSELGNDEGDLFTEIHRLCCEQMQVSTPEGEPRTQGDASK